jgi:hypothetical protein
MKPPRPAANENQIFLDLVTKVKVAITLTSGVLELKCPCGMGILPRTLIVPKVQDRQRGMMKTRIRRHLSERHGLSDHTISVILKEAFAEQ